MSFQTPHQQREARKRFTDGGAQRSVARSYKLPFDLPYQPPSLLRVGLHRLPVDQRIDLMAAFNWPIRRTAGSRVGAMLRVETTMTAKLRFSSVCIEFFQG
jgi:hypothetical protein